MRGLAVLVALVAVGCSKKYPAGGGAGRGPAPTMNRPAPGQPMNARRPPAEPTLAARVVLFTATWCPSCHQLKAEVFNKPAGKALLGGVPLQMVDFDAPGSKPLVMKHQITDLPTTLFLKKDGEEMDRIVGFEGAKAFVGEARAIFAGRDGLHLLEDKLARNPDDVKLHFRVGYRLLLRGKEKRAWAHYDRVLALDPHDKTGAASQVMMHRGRYLVRVRRDFRAAAKLLARAVARYGDGRSGPGLRYWHGWALCKAGRPAEAARALDAYVAAKSRAAIALTLAADLRRKCGHELTKALAMAREATRRKPRDDWAWYLVADLAHTLGHRDESRAAIAKAVALDGASAFYRNEQRRLGR